ncbi:mannan-binding lectin serine protease 1-like [Python bivittatus]|uniref:Mannan-binding lectin serine protease 1-like n=1 Tax=Python bivittatus TaxID=176946 RepID=A0A9F5MZR6_PYTBI|nr:mannan-binding lectin serine protease 1-like [Python bivittatus]
MRLLLVWCLCATQLFSAEAIERNDMFGEILSPSFPDSYPSDSEVTWNISVPDGFRVRLYFMHFDLEPSYLCEYDYVKSGFCPQRIWEIINGQGFVRIYWPNAPSALL